MGLRVSNLPSAWSALALCLVAVLLPGCADDDGAPTSPPEPPGPQPGFQIEIRYLDGTDPTPDQRQVFDQAVARWQQVIVGDVADVTVHRPTPFECQKLTAPPIDELIDDLIVYVEFGPLEDPPDQNWVAWGGPCVLRDNYLPAVSSVTIDIDDMEHLSTRLAIHELGHALGFGEIWLDLGLLADPSNPRNGAPPGVLEAVADATISSHYSDQNFGIPDGSLLSQNLVVGENLGSWTSGPTDEILQGLLRFDLPAVITAPPRWAELQLQANEASEEQGYFFVRLAISEWDETSVTWDSKPSEAYSAWGALLDPATGLLTIEVTEQVSEWLSSPNYGFLVEAWPGDADTLDYNVGFHTRHSTDPHRRPQLSISPDTHFTGPAAMAAFEEVGGSAYEYAKVAVQDNYEAMGDATDCHWRMVVFRGEVMSSSGGDALSLVTIASMEDLGYEVDRSVADPWTFDPTLGYQFVDTVDDAWIDGHAGSQALRFRAASDGSLVTLPPRSSGTDR